jgi:uncharacterized cupin superfamily protein
LTWNTASEGEQVATVDAHARVIGSGSSLEWQEVPRPPGDTAPPGHETILFRSHDRMFSCGFWRRVPETGALEPPFHEIMCLLEGSVAVDRRDGSTLSLGPGDVLAAPHGSRATWRSLAPVRKFWAVHHGPPEARDAEALLGPDVRSVGPAVAFESAEGSFRAGLWRCSGGEEELGEDLDRVWLVLEGGLEVAVGSSRVEGGPGDVVIAPAGARGRWRGEPGTLAFWATYASAG